MLENQDSTTIKQGKETTGYRSVFKATSIFGGVQVFNILVTLVRGKFVAVLIGTAGMGLNGLLMTSLNMITRITGLGLSESAIRDISEAHTSGDEKRITFIYSVVRRWFWFTAVLGVIFTIALAPVLSKIAFGDNSQTVSFLLLSVTFVFSALTASTYAVLRGLRRIKDLAKANIFGSIAGLAIAIPIYYRWGIDGVVPAIIVSAVAGYLISVIFKRNLHLKVIPVSSGELWSSGKQMVNLGMVLTISSLLTSAIKFVLSGYISRFGSLEELGLYNAGNSIMTGYVGMVFTALGTDYFPRLSGVIEKPSEWKRVVNQQAETVMLILGPILAFILMTAPLLIKLLLSEEFLPVVEYLTWASLAIILQGLTWVSGFILISKRDNRVFFYTQLAGQIWFLTLDILFYSLWGIKGLGISLTINYFLAAIMMYLVLKFRYGFKLSSSTYKLAFIFVSILVVNVSIVELIDYPKAYLFSGISFLIAMIVSIHGLNNRMDLLQIIRRFLPNR
jgi:O-antigen/teichoic acid export membrane protein